MGGINLGDLYASLNLDNSDYIRSIKDTQAAQKLLHVSIEELNKDIYHFYGEMEKAGVTAESLSKFILQQNAAVMGTASSYVELTRAIAAAQTQLKLLGSSPVKLSAIDVGNQGRLAEQYYADLNRMERLYQEDLKTRSIMNKEEWASIKARDAEIAAERASRVKVEIESDRIKTAAVLSDINAQEAAYVRMVEQEATAKRLLAQVDKVNTAVFMRDLEAQEAAFLRVQETEAAASSGFGGRFGVRVGPGGITPHGFLGGGNFLAGAAVGLGLYESVKQAAQFEDALSKVDVLLGEVSKDMNDKMAKTAKDLAVQFGISAKDIVLEFGAMQKAGVDANEMFKVLPVVTKLAVGTGNELKDTFKQVLTVMDAMGIPMTQVGKLTDLLAFANQNARGSVEELARAMEGKAAGAFRQYGLTLNEVVALTIAMGRRGIESQVAQTALTQILTKLNASGRDHADILLKIGDHTVRWTNVIHDAQGNMRPLADILESIDKSFTGKSTEKIDEFFKMVGLGGQRDIYLKSLLGLSDEIRKWEKDTTQAFGSVQKASDTAMQSPIRQFDRLKESVRNLGIEIGKELLPPLVSLSDLLTRVVGWMEKWKSYGFGGIKEVAPGWTPGQPIPVAPNVGGDLKPPNTGLTNLRMDPKLAGFATDFGVTISKPDQTPIAVDPAAEEKARIRLDAVRTLFSRFAEDVAVDSEKFGESTKSYVNSMLDNINSMFSRGLNPALIRDKIGQDQAILSGLKEAVKLRSDDQKLIDKNTDSVIKMGEAEDRTTKTMLRGLMESKDLLHRVYEDQKKASEDVEQFNVLFKSPQEQLRKSGRSDLADQVDVAVRLRNSYAALGMTVETETDASMRKLLERFHEVVDSAKQLDTVRTAWAAVDGAISKLSKISLPEAVKEYRYLEAQLKSRGASEGEILGITEKRLKVEVETAVQEGRDATGLINKLTLVEMRSKIMRDTSTAIGETGKSIYMQLNAGFEVLFTSIGKNIFAMKSLKEVALNFLNSLASNIFGQVFGLFGKFLGNSIFSGLGGLFGAGGGLGGGFATGGGGFFGSGITAYAAGAWDTGNRAHLSVIHPHEMVLNESVAGAVRSGGFGGGGDNTVHIDFRGASFSGVTQSLVDSVMNKAVKSARLSGSKFGPIG